MHFGCLELKREFYIIIKKLTLSLSVFLNHNKLVLKWIKYSENTYIVIATYRDMFEHASVG